MEEASRQPVPTDPSSATRALDGYVGDLDRPASGHADQAFSIIGPSDDRRIELGTTQAPWRAICALEIDTAKGPFRGTGWLAGPRLVVTAGHCVFDPDRFGGWARAIRVTPGCAWGQQPFGVFESRRFDATAAWRQARDPAADIGAIHLDADVGQQVGWLGAVATPPEDIAGVVVSGYPEFAGSYEHLLVGEGPARGVIAGRLHYDLDTSEGQSGGPVWRAADAARVVAVHAYDVTAAAAGAGVANSGPLLTAALLSDIQAWRDQASS